MTSRFRFAVASFLSVLFLTALSSPADGVSAARLVPVVVDVRGFGGALFSTELVFSNAGTMDATASLVYTASLTAVVGLLENGADRSNLALVNAGTGGPVTLHVTLISGDGTLYQPLSPDVVLQPGEWTQINRVLASPGAGFSSGWAFVERVSGADPFFAYGVVNDGATDTSGTNDGAYVPMAKVK